MVELNDLLLKKLKANGQEHLVRYWDRLDRERQSSLLRQIESLDFETLHQARRGGVETDWRGIASRAVPAPAIRLSQQGREELRNKAKNLGIQALRRGEVGAVLVAGGQGTRLGFNGPKGMYPIGPVSGDSLFKIFCQKVLSVGRRHGHAIPLYIMTSPHTHLPTADFLAENNRFGLAEKDVRLFTQGLMPAVGPDSGRILMESTSEMAMSPDGHGGIVSAMSKYDLFEDFVRRNLKQLFYFQVDNPLVRICDEEFLGLSLMHSAEVATQVVAKRHASERVGNVVSVDGRVQIIEYSDLPPEAAQRINPDGTPYFWAGNIAVHIFGVEFLRQASTSDSALPWHVARKKVPAIDDSGNLTNPQEPNALKFERFVFDLLPAAKSSLVMEVDAKSAFAPVKNAPGEPTDSPDTVRAQMIALHRQWLQEAGVFTDERIAVEISPAFADSPEELVGKVERGSRINQPTYFA